MVDQPIGVFDSGVGGLAVVAALQRLLPAENILYLGDTARVPYGNKSAETVLRYTRRCGSFLVDQKVKFLILACNTASAVALAALRSELPVPVIETIEPSAQEAAERTRTGTIGVIGTLRTIESHVYEETMRTLNPTLRVVARAAPLLVPLVEEGWTDNEIAKMATAEYLRSLVAGAADLDVLILGCTHYSLMNGTIAEVVRAETGREIPLIDSAKAAARVAAESLTSSGLTRSGGTGTTHYLITDETRFTEVGERFLGAPLKNVTRIDL